MEMRKKQRKQIIRAIKWAIFLGVVVAFFLPAIVLASAPFSDDFEDYNLGNLHGQGGWVKYSEVSHQVVNNNSNSPSQSVSCASGSPCLSYKEGELIPSGGWDFYFYSVSPSLNLEIVWTESFAMTARQLGYIAIFNSGGYKIFYQNTYTFLSNVELDAWNKVSFEWEKETQKVRFSYNDGEWSSWVEPNYNRGASGDFTGCSMVNPMFGGSGGIWVDDFSPPSPPPLRVWGVSPASGTTSTSTATNFTIGWEGFDFEYIYTDFVFSFYEENTGIVVGTEIYTPTTTDGTYALPFSDFGFDKNGKYYFSAKARSPLYEYTAYYTSDLVSPEWWINFNVSGWEAIFEMPEFQSWYASSSKFATPTAIFSGVAGFLSPVYSKIGEFGSKVIVFLDLNEAYDRGYDLGKIIPTFKHYVSEIEVFFGGFPIIQIFLAFLVILLGIFIIRLILKFIPGLG